MDIHKKLGFDKLLEYLDKYLSDIGRTKVKEISFSTDPDKINVQLSAISDFIDILHNHNFPLDYYYDLRPALEKIQSNGLYLTEIELIRLAQSLQTIREIKQFFSRRDLLDKFHSLRQITNKIKFFPFIIERIFQVLNKKGEILDNASRELMTIRRQLSDMQSQVSSVVQHALRQARAQGLVEPDMNIVVRGNKYLIPVPAAKKNRVPGIVQDQSATGKTVFIEPIKAVELHNQITELEFAEKREIIRILTQLADDIRPYIPELLQNYEILSELDFVRAKALLAIELDAQKPQITEQPMIDLQQARHPLLLLSYKQSGRKVVPLNIKIDDEQRIVLISGPNAGGKSVALKTVGLVQYMTQCGFLPPVRFSSTIGIFDQIFVDIGDDQSIENDLSTYSSHLLNIKNIVNKASEKSLVLIDEFGAGTDPAFGGALAEAALETMLNKKLKAVITTHYSNLKHFAASNQGIVNAAMLFDSQQLKPLYKLETGRPGSSFALEIASSIGLPQDIISRAKEKIGSSQVDFDRILLEIERERQRTTQQRKKYEKLVAQLTDKVAAYRREYEKLMREKKRIISEANQEADQILSQANSLIENTIRQIREQQAKKETTREIRKNFEQQKQKLNKHRQQLEKQITHKLEENLRKQKKLPEKKNTGKIEVGDYVQHRKSGIKGQVQSIKDKRALVLMGNLKTFVPLDDLIKLTSQQAQELKRLEKKGGVKINMDKPGQFITALDVRGMRSEQALQKVMKFIDAALVAGTHEIRILHGTGDGILRKFIRSYLQKLDYIESYGDAAPRLGGPGVTVVKFK